MLRRIAPIALGLAAGLCSAAGCGLGPVEGIPSVDAGGTADGSSAQGPDTGGTQQDDGGSDKDSAAPPPADTTCADTGEACAAPEGWAPVAVTIGEGTSCEPGYSKLTLVEGTLIDPQQACECNPTPSLADPPRCDKASDYKVTGGIDVGAVPALCTGATQLSAAVDGNACTALPGASAWDALLAAPIAPTQGTCDPQCAGQPNHLKTTPTHICVPSDACLQGTCRGARAGTRDDKFAYCFLKDGDQSCPGDTDTFVRRLLGTSASIACNATCANHAQCTNANLELFDNPGCANASYMTALANDQCGRLPDKALQAFKYSATLTTAPAIDGPVNAAVVHAEPKTLCCAAGE